MKALTLCLLLSIVAIAAGEGGIFCNVCELMINDVKHRNPSGFDSMDQATLEKQMYEECDKYVSTLPFEATACKNIIKNNEARLLQALKDNVSAYLCCKAVNLCT